MSWLSTIFIALITGAVGLFLSGYVASLAVSWYRISSFEGGSGYFVVLTAIGGMVFGLVLGVVVSRVVAMTANPGFLKGLGWSLLCMLLTVTTVGGSSRLKADIPPTIDGEELMLQFIAAWPNYEAMVRRIPRRRSYAEEPAHTFRPSRLAGIDPG